MNKVMHSNEPLIKQKDVFKQNNKKWNCSINQNQNDRNRVVNDTKEGCHNIPQNVIPPMETSEHILSDIIQGGAANELGKDTKSSKQCAVSGYNTVELSKYGTHLMNHIEGCSLPQSNVERTEFAEVTQFQLEGCNTESTFERESIGNYVKIEYGSSSRDGHSPKQNNGDVENMHGSDDDNSLELITMTPETVGCIQFGHKDIEGGSSSETNTGNPETVNDIESQREDCSSDSDRRSVECVHGVEFEYEDSEDENSLCSDRRNVEVVHGMEFEYEDSEDENSLCLERRSVECVHGVEFEYEDSEGENSTDSDRRNVEVVHGMEFEYEDSEDDENSSETSSNTPETINDITLGYVNSEEDNSSSDAIDLQGVIQSDDQIIDSDNESSCSSDYTEDELDTANSSLARLSIVALQSKAIRKNQLERPQRIQQALFQNSTSVFCLQLIAEVADAVLQKLQSVLGDSATWVKLAGKQYTAGCACDADVKSRDLWLDLFLQFVCGWPDNVLAFGPCKLDPLYDNDTSIYGTIEQPGLFHQLPPTNLTLKMKEFVQGVQKSNFTNYNPSQNEAIAQHVIQVVTNEISPIFQVNVGIGPPKNPTKEQMQFLSKLIEASCNTITGFNEKLIPLLSQAECQ